VVAGAVSGHLRPHAQRRDFSSVAAPVGSVRPRAGEVAVAFRGNASAMFSLARGTPAAFDSRACLAAEDEQVSDYFRWRQADAARCALNGWCYWTLRKAGAGVAEATKVLQGKNAAFKNELLFQRGINFNDVPHWQRRGTGLYWRQEPHVGHDPV